MDFGSLYLIRVKPIDRDAPFTDFNQFSSYVDDITNPLSFIRFNRGETRV